jgi:hypothetical protein
MPQEIIDIVIIGFTATVADPMLEVRRIERTKKLIAEGKQVKEIGVKKNQVDAFSTAYYQYNHMWHTLQQRLVYLRSKYTKEPAKGHNNYCILKIPFDKLPDGFQSEESLDMAKQKMSNNEFLMEYSNKYLSDSDGFYRMSILDNAISKKCSFKYYGDGVHEYFLAIDPARNKDNCAFVVIQVGDENESSVIVSIETLNDKSYTVIHEKILEILDRYDISEMAIDKGGGGSEIKDKLCDPEKMKGRELIWDIDDPISYINGLRTNPRPGRHILRMFKSAPNLLADANHGLLAKLEKCSLVFAREPSIEQRQNASEIETIWYDVQEDEFDKAKKEMSSVVVSGTKHGVLHWDTEGKHQHKDRYSAILIGANMLKVMKDEILENKDKDLVNGFWLGQTKKQIVQTKNGFFEDASL